MIEEDTMPHVIKKIAFEKTKKDIKTALNSIEAAKHYLDETEHYQSEVLDEAYIKLSECVYLLKNVLSKGEI